MKNQKSWKSFELQLELLKSRGLNISDDNKVLGYLRSIGYYRLSGYLYSFRQPDPNSPKQRLDNFIENSDFDDVIALYVFDKKLRQLALDALERIEIALRLNISHLLGKYDPLAYQKREYFNADFDHQSWIVRYQSLLDRESRTSFVKHHLEHYGDLPIWASCEVWDFGAMSKLYKGMLEKDKDHIAKLYRLKSGSHLQSHLHI